MKESNLDLIVLDFSIRLEGMRAANYEREQKQEALAYSEQSFVELQAKLSETIKKYNAFVLSHSKVLKVNKTQSGIEVPK